MQLNTPSDIMAQLLRSTNSPPSEDPTHPTLCERCSILVIGRDAPGCREVLDDDGNLILKIKGEGIRLAYSLQDTFPNFPALSLTAAASCEFCQLFKTRLTERYCHKVPPWQFHNHYRSKP